MIINTFGGGVSGVSGYKINKIVVSLRSFEIDHLLGHR